MMISHIQYNPIVKTEKNYLRVKCDLCKKDMILTEGSIIIGNKWYHDDCFNHIHFVKSVSVKYPKTRHNIKNIRID